MSSALTVTFPLPDRPKMIEVVLSPAGFPDAPEGLPGTARVTRSASHDIAPTAAAEEYAQMAQVYMRAFLDSRRTFDLAKAMAYDTAARSQRALAQLISCPCWDNGCEVAREHDHPIRDQRCHDCRSGCTCDKEVITAIRWAR